MQQIGLVLFRFVIWFFKLTPFRVVYLLSDLMYLVIFHMVRYRRKVVDANIRKAFPNKSDKEIATITRDFYELLCDNLLESIKGSSMSAEEIARRYPITATTELQHDFEKGQQIILVAGHVSNWEWAALSLPLHLSHKIVALYKPLSNKKAERFILDTREKTGAAFRPISKTPQAFLEQHEKPSAVVLAADQSPTSLLHQLF